MMVRVSGLVVSVTQIGCVCSSLQFILNGMGKLAYLSQGPSWEVVASRSQSLNTAAVVPPPSTVPCSHGGVLSCPQKD